MRFEGTAAYVADKDLMVAVNAAIALERPLLVKGEPVSPRDALDFRSDPFDTGFVVQPQNARPRGWLDSARPQQIGDDMNRHVQTLRDLTDSHQWIMFHFLLSPQKLICYPECLVDWQKVNCTAHSCHTCV